MGNRKFRDDIKPPLDNGNCKFSHVVSDGGDRLHDGTNKSNEIGILIGNKYPIFQKVMLSSPKYHQRRKALTEMVSAWLDEGLGGRRIVPETYAELFNLTSFYEQNWGAVPKEADRIRVCHVVHRYVKAVPGDEWRGNVYKRRGSLPGADAFCRSIIEANPDAERMALLDFATINQDRSARNWITDGERFYAVDNGMAWFHEYPDSDDWKIGTVIDDVLLQVGEWRFISGVFTTSYAGRQLSPTLLEQLRQFSWPNFCEGLDESCEALGLPPLSSDWRFLGLRRRLEWIVARGFFPAADEYRGWLTNGSEFMTPPEIVKSGGKIVWKIDEDR